VIWATGLTVLGYFLGNVEFVQRNIDLIAVAIIALSLVPAFVEWLRARRRADAAT
jgi:membrane-associated protein